MYKIQKFLRNNKKEDGFSLIELVIVVVIMAILAAIIIPIYANQQKEALRGRLKSDITATADGLLTWQVTNGLHNFPDGGSSTAANWTASTSNNLSCNKAVAGSAYVTKIRNASGNVVNSAPTASSNASDEFIQLCMYYQGSGNIEAYQYCVQGTQNIGPLDIWSYDIRTKVLSNAACPTTAPALTTENPN